MSTIADVFYREWQGGKISIQIYEDLLDCSLILDIHVGWFNLGVTLLPWHIWQRIVSLRSKKRKEGKSNV